MNMAIDPEVIPSSSSAGQNAVRFFPKWAIYGIIGLMILAVSAIWGHDILGETGEIVATLLGASVLSFGHYRNQKLCKDCCN